MTASTGRRFTADKSVNGNGTSSRSPRSNIVPDFIFRIVPHRGKAGGLRVHEVAPFRAIAPLTKESDEVEHLARERIGQQFHLIVNHVGDGHAGLRDSRPFSHPITFAMRGGVPRPSSPGYSGEADRAKSLKCSLFFHHLS